VALAAAGPRPGAGDPPAPAFLAGLRAARPLNPVGLAGDPYAPGRAVPVARPGAACAVRFEPDRVHYRLATFEGEAGARAAGYRLTHHGACGTCSTLQDLAVYLERPDLTAPVRRCAALPLKPWSLDCLAALGFSGACALTWYWNGRNTARECLGTCLWDWLTGAPSNLPGGGLGDCLRCDEERSGAVFQRVAGRTRRNSGIVSSIGRGPAEVRPVVHDELP
jgi:hypothetical protein